MKKILVIAIIVIVLIIGILLGIKAYEHQKYSLEKMIEYFDTISEIPNNIYIKNELNNIEDGKTKTSEIDLYVKDNVIYIKQYGEEVQKLDSMFDFENLKECFVDYDRKEIRYCPLITETKEELLPDTFRMAEVINDEYWKYKYEGKENINQIKYLKFSLTHENSKIIFYLDMENNQILKNEGYDIKDNGKLELRSVNIYEYLYNVVTDEDVTLDMNEYSDYKVIDNYTQK